MCGEGRVNTAFQEVRKWPIGGLLGSWVCEDRTDCWIERHKEFCNQQTENSNRQKLQSVSDNGDEGAEDEMGSRKDGEVD